MVPNRLHRRRRRRSRALHSRHRLQRRRVLVHLAQRPPSNLRLRASLRQRLRARRILFAHVRLQALEPNPRRVRLQNLTKRQKRFPRRERHRQRARAVRLRRRVGAVSRQQRLREFPLARLHRLRQHRQPASVERVKLQRHHADAAVDSHRGVEVALELVALVALHVGDGEQ